MSRAPVRRGQLIAPFGTGALLVAPDGASIIAAGLDHWFERDGQHIGVDIEEFRINEWRLERRLGVDHFRLPPDFRRPNRGTSETNTLLEIPFLRFPRWHFCWRCHRLQQLPLTAMGRRYCLNCESTGDRSELAQVPFVAMCGDGHVQDFPWREWVHRSANPPCNQPLSLIATGGATLANQVVKCECGVPPRSLAGITAGSPDGSTTFLSSNLEPGKDSIYNCEGSSPQHGTTEGHGCTRPLRGSLRSASNLYFAVTASAIYLPREGVDIPSELLSILEQPDSIAFIKSLSQAAGSVPVATLRAWKPQVLKPFSGDQLEKGVEVALERDRGDVQNDDETEQDFRLAEAALLRDTMLAEELTVRPIALEEYGDLLGNYFGRLCLVERLRETRVLRGFNRVFPDQEVSQRDRMRQLWEEPGPLSDSWLPGHCVYGEGIYIELDEDVLVMWERRPDVEQRVERLQDLYDHARAGRQLQERSLNPRFVLAHTLSHLLMNQLTFDCGYSTAALRERIYVSSDARSSIAGILIYTAAGDAEGTMGGLVRMGKPGNLENVVTKALADSEWCAADPVCMEIGSTTGQGPDSCNLAACHSCALVPETACEEFNRFLDRGLLVGTLESRSLGFFNTK